MSFVSFIKNLKSDQAQNTIYVLGNPSADYDSFFGSIICAYYLTKALKIPHIPLIDCKPEDVHLRFQIAYILQKINVNTDDLIYFSQVNCQKNSRYILYDHSNRQNLKIERIIDHHDFKEVPSQKYLIYPTGSSLTLLYYLMNPHLIEFIKTADPSFKKLLIQFTSNNFSALHQYDPLIDQLIRYGVLMDCYDFDIKHSQRWTQYDLFAIKQIQNKNKFQIGYQQLNEIKFNEQISLKLTCSDHLRKDTKQFLYEIRNSEPNDRYTADYSVILLNSTIFLDNYGKYLQQSVLKYRQSFDKSEQYGYNLKGQCFFLLLIYKRQGKINRQIMFRCDNQEYEKKIRAIIHKLKMEERQSKIQKWKIFVDVSSNISRKLFDKEMKQSL